jgi:RNase P subunit RPR2
MAITCMVCGKTTRIMLKPREKTERKRHSAKQQD